MTTATRRPFICVENATGPCGANACPTCGRCPGCCALMGHGEQSCAHPDRPVGHPACSGECACYKRGREEAVETVEEWRETEQPERG